MGFSIGGVNRIALVVLMCFATLAEHLLPQAWAQMPDTQSLVGEWHGSWTSHHRPGQGGEHNMTVTKVDGNRVSGRIERGGTAKAAYHFVGTLEGNTLIIQGSMARTELTVNGNQMRGFLIGANRLDTTMTQMTKK